MAGGESDQEDELDAALGPLQPIYSPSSSLPASQQRSLQPNLSQPSTSGQPCIAACSAKCDDAWLLQDLEDPSAMLLK